VRPARDGASKGAPSDSTRKGRVGTGSVPSSHQVGKGGRSVSVATASDVQRALVRIGHEVLERNKGVEDLVVVGLQRGGVPFAERLSSVLGEVSGQSIPVGVLGITMHRDDLSLRPVVPEDVTHLPVDIDSKVVLLVDDVIYTGRTVRAALEALLSWGRPAAVQLAVMVDRGHRELPIRPDYVGRNLPTSREETVEATLEGIWIKQSSQPRFPSQRPGEGELA